MVGKIIVTNHVLQGEVMGNPDDFSDPNNIDAPDIPEEHKVAYAQDLYYLGPTKTFWTPRRRMLKSIEWNENKVNAKKAKRQVERRAKLDAWGEQRKIDARQAEHSARIAANWPDNTPERVSFWGTVATVVIAVVLFGVFWFVFIGLASLMGLG